MTKKVFTVILTGGVVIATALGVYYWQFVSKKTSVESPLPQAVVSSDKEETEVWKDQAGFSFSYPKKLVSDIHEEDKENYAHIEFTHSDYPGSVTIWAKDTTAADAAAWIKQEKSLANGTVFDTELAGQTGTKILITNPKKKIITAVVDDAIVFYIEGEFDQSEYWTAAYETIVSSFSFIRENEDAPSTSVTTSSAQEEEVSVDEEEVLE